MAEEEDLVSRSTKKVKMDSHVGDSVEIKEQECDGTKDRDCKIVDIILEGLVNKEGKDLKKKIVNDSDTVRKLSYKEMMLSKGIRDDLKPNEIADMVVEQYIHEEDFKEEPKGPFGPKPAIPVSLEELDN